MRDADDLTDAMTIVIHLPQPLEKVAALLVALGELFPDATSAGGLARLEVPADAG